MTYSDHGLRLLASAWRAYARHASADRAEAKHIATAWRAIAEGRHARAAAALDSAARAIGNAERPLGMFVASALRQLQAGAPDAAEAYGPTWVVCGFRPRPAGPGR